MNKEIEDIIYNIFSTMNLYKFNLSDEKILQEQIFSVLKGKVNNLKKEYRLNEKDIVDFYVDGIGIEIKIKGTVKNIYRQLERYSLSDKIHSLILVSSKYMGLPETINNKNIYFYNLSINHI